MGCACTTTRDTDAGCARTRCVGSVGIGFVGIHFACWMLACTGRNRIDDAADLVAGSANIDLARTDPAFSSSIGVGSQYKRCQISDSAYWSLAWTDRVRIDVAAGLACNGHADAGSRWMRCESHGSACWILARTGRLRIGRAAGVADGLVSGIACYGRADAGPRRTRGERTGPGCFDRARMGSACTKCSSPGPASTSPAHKMGQSIGQSSSSPERMGSGCTKCEKSGCASIGPTCGKCEKLTSCRPANTDLICTSPDSSFAERILRAVQAVPAAFALDACRWRCGSRRCGGEDTWSI